MLPVRLPLEQMQVKWKSELDPILSIPLLKGLQLKNIELIAGTNVINTLLGRLQQGFIITDIDAPATIYRSQPFNSLTLTLTSSAACNVSLLVY